MWMLSLTSTTSLYLFNLILYTFVGKDISQIAVKLLVFQSVSLFDEKKFESSFYPTTATRFDENSISMIETPPCS